MGVVRHKVRKGRNQGIWHFCTDMFIYPGKVGVPSIAPFTTDSEFYKSNSHRLLYPAHPSVFLKDFHSVLACQQIDG